MDWGFLVWFGLGFILVGIALGSPPPPLPQMLQQYWQGKNILFYS